MRRSGRGPVGVVVAAFAVLVASGLTGCHRIDTTAFPRLYVGLGVRMPMRSTGGEGPLTWSATGLPPGVSIEPGTGVISGAPTTAGTYSVTVSAVDPAADGATATTTYPLEVSEPPTIDTVQSHDDAVEAYEAVISDDGRHVAYVSTDRQYRPAGTFGFAYVTFDRVTRTRTLVFFDAADVYDRPAISGDGRSVAFVDSPATSADPTRIGIWDRTTATTEWIPGPTGAASITGASSPSLSDDGRFVAYSVVSGSTSLVFVYDREETTTVQVTPVPVRIPSAVLSGDGSTVVFATNTPGVVEGDDNGRNDVFVWTRATQALRRVTDTRSGDPLFTSSTPGVSEDGGVVAFDADLGVGVAVGSFVWDRATDSVIEAPTPGLAPSVSSDGRRIVYSSSGSSVPAGGSTQLMWDRPTGSVRRMAGDAMFAGKLSGDGRHVVAGGSFLEPGLYVWELLD